MGIRDTLKSRLLIGFFRDNPGLSDDEESRMMELLDNILEILKGPEGDELMKELRREAAAEAEQKLPRDWGDKISRK